MVFAGYQRPQRPRTSGGNRISRPAKSPDTYPQNALRARYRVIKGAVIRVSPAFCCVCMTLISAGAAGRRARGRAGLARPQELRHDPALRPADPQEPARRRTGFGGTWTDRLSVARKPLCSASYGPIAATNDARFRTFSVLFRLQPTFLAQTKRILPWIMI